MLTKRQKQALDCIKKLISKNGYAPSLEEIKKELGLSSVSTAHHYVSVLEKNGYLLKSDNLPRAIEIDNTNETIPIRLCGLIAAGAPIETIEKFEIIRVPKSIARDPDDYFALEVSGNSMIEEGIFDGDHVVIKKQSNFRDGDTIVAIINGSEATLKRIYKIEGGFKLQPANPELRPFTVKEIIVQGKVVSVMRNYESRKPINTDINFVSFLADLKDLITRAQMEAEEQFTINAEYQRWSLTEEKPDSSKFFTETAYCLLNEALLLWISRDKKLINFESINNSKQFDLNKRQIKEVYSHIFENDIFDWLTPSDNFFYQISNSFNHYNFSEVDRDLLGKLYDKFIPAEQRKALGQFYTPDSVVDYILDQVGYIEKNIIGKKVIDIACGSGGFLSRACNRLITSLKKHGASDSEIITQVINSIYGLDINPFARYLAETNILIQILDFIVEVKRQKSTFKIPRIKVYQTNTLENSSLFSGDDQILRDIKNNTGLFSAGFDYVVGNPPYLEAKKMDTETKEFCKNRCPSISKGAFDLFVCFIDIGLKMLSPQGKIGYIIPNKFLIASYAKPLRTEILEHYTIEEIIDVSSCEVFENTSVYPIILILDNKQPNNKTMVSVSEDIKSTQNLRNHNFVKTQVQQELYKRDDFIYFLLPQNQTERDLLVKLLHLPDTLENFLDIKWTISFHAAGLRESFLFDHKPDTEFDKKLIGRKSFGGNSDVGRYDLNWSGWWIKYDENLAKFNKNPLPPKEIFEKEKLIICQNALRLRATYDNNGYFCKDTFFVANLKDSVSRAHDIKYFLALMNSKLMHYYYANIYKGTHINGGYLHYLIGYLNSLPAAAAATSDKELCIVGLVDKILATHDSNIFSVLDEKIDELIYEIYDLKDKEKETVRSF